MITMAVILIGLKKEGFKKFFIFFLNLKVSHLQATYTFLIFPLVGISYPKATFPYL